MTRVLTSLCILLIGMAIYGDEIPSFSSANANIRFEIRDDQRLLTIQSDFFDKSIPPQYSNIQNVKLEREGKDVHFYVSNRFLKKAIDLRCKFHPIAANEFLLLYEKEGSWLLGDIFVKKLSHSWEIRLELSPENLVLGKFDVNKSESVKVILLVEE